MLHAYARAASKDEELGDKVAKWIAISGVAFAVFKLLKLVFDE